MKKLVLIIFIFFSFIQTTLATEISYDKHNFAPISSMIPDASYDIRYYSSNNFTGTKIKGYNAPIPYLTKEALQALSIAEKDLRRQGYRLLIWDAYRPQKAVDNFIEWINNPNDIGNKKFYPNINKSDLLKAQYIMAKSGHTRGSTVDLTLIKKDGSYVDMGGSFDLFDKTSQTNYKKLTKEQKKNRRILHRAMRKAGFKGINSEWWHFTLKNEPYPNTYFDFNIE